MSMHVYAAGRRVIWTLKRYADLYDVGVRACVARVQAGGRENRKERSIDVWASIRGACVRVRAVEGWLRGLSVCHHRPLCADLRDPQPPCMTGAAQHTNSQRMAGVGRAAPKC
ncbi:hypothetical protein E2C01_083139 [Portunus trituberculatus]|uniref:Uncharacterized protein n=1 Tax=Portunus trituberculatus TaxID=210409 RepID=A0A5B7J0Y6_PORTR|nr:hypothetical protein [Portunus trituberculatus]